MNSLKILVTGAAGQLGNELRSILEERMPGQTVYVDLPQADLTSRELAEDLLRQGGFTHVVNCAAYTAVDRAEEEKLQCKEVNEGIVSNLARIADELGTRIIHISTDYVFDGNTCRPYTESDKPEPLSVYGATKRKSETILLGLAPNSMVLRTGWLYSPHGHNFMKTVLSLAEKKDRIGIVADQTGTPTYARDLASAIVSILESNHWVPGVFHFANEGVATWYDFAVAILEEAGMPEKAAVVAPISTADYPCAAARPHYSVLDKSRFKATFGITMPHWRDGLRRCMAEMAAIN